MKGRRSSEKVFREIVNTLWDNSTGDHNYIPYEFIDESGLQEQFKEFMMAKVGHYAYSEGYFDGEYRSHHDERWKKVGKKYPELWERYHEGYLDGRRGNEAKS